jgi:O-antigen/teichoic acid export membrane protein
MSRLGSFVARHRHANWTLADQAVVSGGNFFTGIMLARFLGPAAFGVFVLLQAALLYVNSFQGALIFNPMMSTAPQLAAPERESYLRGVFALQLILTMTLAVAVWSAGTLFHLASESDAARALRPPLLFALSFAVLSFQLQDWYRRYCFVRERASSAFFNDLICFGGQTGALVFAGLTDRLTVVSAFVIIGAACLTAFSVGYLRSFVAPTFANARALLRDGWRAGRDYLAAWQLQLITAQGVLAAAAGIVGPQAAGGVRAAQNIVGPVNILFQVMDNIVPVVAAGRYGKGGMDSLSAYLRRIVRWGTAALVPTLLLLAVFSAPLTQLAYGDRYVGFASLVVWAAASMFLQFYLRVSFVFLRTVMATGAVLRTGVVMAIATMTVALVAIPAYHEDGVMISLLSGVCAGLCYSVSASLRIASALRRLSAVGAQTARPASNWSV